MDNWDLILRTKISDIEFMIMIPKHIFNVDYIISEDSKLFWATRIKEKKVDLKELLDALEQSFLERKLDMHGHAKAVAEILNYEERDPPIIPINKFYYFDKWFGPLFGDPKVGRPSAIEKVGVLWESRWFLKFTSESDATDFIIDDKIGTFAFRFSRTNLGHFTCSIVELINGTKEVVHYLVNKTPDGRYYFDIAEMENVKCFTLNELYQRSITPNGTKFEELLSEKTLNSSSNYNSTNFINSKKTKYLSDRKLSNSSETNCLN